jgi:hypothetical protein
MAIEAKAFDNLTVDAFVGEESHRGIVSSRPAYRFELAKSSGGLPRLLLRHAVEGA